MWHLKIARNTIVRIGIREKVTEQSQQSYPIFFTLLYTGSEVGFQLLQLIRINIKFWVHHRHSEEARAGNKLLSVIQKFLWVVRKTRSSKG